MTFQEQAKEAIRASGGRITTQRELLLHLLDTLDSDVDAETLHQLASQSDPNISLPTVYRTLHTLENARVIASQYISSDHERKVYRVMQDTQRFHFTCSRCGQVTVFQSDLISRLISELNSQLDAEVMNLCMCAGGLCSDCREEQIK